MAKIAGVILDVDGTLVDSNEAHARSWSAALAEFGFHVPVETILPLIGMGSDKLLPQVSGVSSESERGEEIGTRRGEIFAREELPRLRGFPKVRELLTRMRDDGIKIVVASSAEKGDLDQLLAVAKALDFVEEKTSSDDAERSKPDPDIVHAALANLGIPADRVIMLGDTPYDVEAATRAGVRVIAVRCGGWDDEGLRGAVEVYDDPADLLAHYESSALA